MTITVKSIVTSEMGIEVEQSYRTPIIARAIADVQYFQSKGRKAWIEVSA